MKFLAGYSMPFNLIGEYRMQIGGYIYIHDIRWLLCFFYKEEKDIEF